MIGHFVRFVIACTAEVLADTSCTSTWRPRRLTIVYSGYILIYIIYIHMYIGDVWLYNHGYIIILWTGLRASTVSNSLNKYFKQGLLASWRLKRFACEATQLGVLSKEAASTSFWSHQWLHLKIIQWDPEFPWVTIAALWPWHYHLVNTQKITKSYWTWPFIVDLPIKNGDSP